MTIITHPSGNVDSEPAGGCWAHNTIYIQHQKKVSAQLRANMQQDELTYVAALNHLACLWVL